VDNPTTVQTLKRQVLLLEHEIRAVKDRLLVVERESTSNRNMIDELNEWKDQVDDRLDAEL